MIFNGFKITSSQKKRVLDIKGNLETYEICFFLCQEVVRILLWFVISNLVSCQGLLEPSLRAHVSCFWEGL